MSGHTVESTNILVNNFFTITGHCRLQVASKYTANSSDTAPCINRKSATSIIVVYLGIQYLLKYICSGLTSGVSVDPYESAYILVSIFITITGHCRLQGVSMYTANSSYSAPCINRKSETCIIVNYRGVQYLFEINL